MIDRESVLHQLCREPSTAVVTVFALQAKKAHMNFWFSMTVFALSRGILVALVAVAGLALDPNVGSIQLENYLVIEFAHAVRTVMTFQAAATHLQLVLTHKYLIIECVAAKASLF
jgi:hypothetical protein